MSLHLRLCTFHRNQLALLANVSAINDGATILRELREGFRVMKQRFDRLENAMLTE